MIGLEYAGGRLRCLIDTAGREIRVKTTAGGRIVRLEVWVEERLEQWADYTYSKMGELASAADALGHTERYEYDEDHRLVKKTLKNGTNVYYVYDEKTGRCKRSFCDGGVHEGYIEYDLENRITRLWGSDEPRVLYWNEDGLVVREETPDGVLIKTCEYDEDQYLVAEVNGAGEATRYHYDELGNKIREIDAAGNVSEWTYEGDLPVVRSGADGLITRYRHDARGSLVEVIYPSELRYALMYDGRGHLREVQGNEGVLATFEVDSRHNLVGETDARGGRTAYAYDPVGRPLTRTDALGRVTEVAYDRLGQPEVVHRQDGTSVQTRYDALGNPIEVRDALGQVTAMEYGGTGVLTKLIQPDKHEWRFKYTAGEKLRIIENPKKERYEFTYDAAGRVIEELTFDERRLVYRYSKAGRLARIEYPDGSFRAFEHDPLGNVLREASTDGPISFQRDRMGRLLGAAVEQDGQQVVTLFERDRLGRVVAEVQDGRRLRYEYDSRVRRTSRVMPDGATTRYRYDALGELVELCHDGYEMTFERDVLGREKARRDASGKVSIRSEYDSMDRIIDQRVDVRAPGGGVPTAVVQRMWQYDPLGRVKLVEDGRWGTTTYRYDAVGQLLEARRGANREVFAYDAAGSIQKMIEGLDTSPEQAAESEAWQIGKGNLLLKTDRATYAYDRRGRRVSKEEGGQRTEYIWDARDRLREVTLSSGERVLFKYDAFARRVRKEICDEYGDRSYAVDFIWDGDVLAADLDSRYVARCFVYAPGSFVPLLQAEQGEVFSYIVDQVGVPKELVDRAGRVVWSAAHSAWGRLIEGYREPVYKEIPGRLLESPFRLLGQYSDGETNLSYARFRYFDAEVGRWCSSDPIGVLGGPNLFAFDGAPTRLVDPLGLSCRLNNFQRKVEAKDLRGAPPFGSARTPGHARSKHGFTNEDMVPILNEPDRVFSGVNKNGRNVDIYAKDGSVVITEAGDKTSVITAFGAGSQKGGNSAVDPQKWTDPSKWAPGERYVEIGTSNGALEVIYPDRASWAADWF